MAKPYDLQLFHFRIPQYFRIAAGLVLLASFPPGITAEENHFRAGSGTAYRSIDDLLLIGLAENPAVLAAKARWKASSTAIPAQRTLPDPTLGYTHHLESVETRIGPQLGGLSISQRLPWLGKLRLDGRIAELRAEEQYFQYLAIIQQVAAIIEDAYWDYHYLLQALDITEQNLELMRNWEQVALSKYTTARAGHPDIIKAQIEVLNLEDQLISLQRRQRPLLERLSAATGRQLTISSLDIEEPRLPDSIPGIDSLQMELFQHSPDLLGSKVRIDLAETGVNRARLNYLPDFSIGGSTIFTGKNPLLDADDPENGKDPFMISVGLSIPIHFRKYRSLEQSARIGQRSAELAERDLENQLRAQLEAILFELEDATRKARLYKEALIPRAEQSVLTSEKAYIGDAVDFLTLIEAQRVLLTYQLSYQKALAGQASQRAQLTALLGRYSVNTSINGES